MEFNSFFTDFKKAMSNQLITLLIGLPIFTMGFPWIFENIYELCGSESSSIAFWYKFFVSTYFNMPILVFIILNCRYSKKIKASNLTPRMISNITMRIPIISGIIIIITLLLTFTGLNFVKYDSIQNSYIEIENSKEKAKKIDSEYNASYIKLMEVFLSNNKFKNCSEFEVNKDTDKLIQLQNCLYYQNHKINESGSYLSSLLTVGLILRYVHILDFCNGLKYLKQTIANTDSESLKQGKFENLKNLCNTNFEYYLNKSKLETMKHNNLKDTNVKNIKNELDNIRLSGLIYLFIIIVILFAFIKFNMYNLKKRQIEADINFIKYSEKLNLILGILIFLFIPLFKTIDVQKINTEKPLSGLFNSSWNLPAFIAESFEPSNANQQNISDISILKEKLEAIEKTTHNLDCRTQKIDTTIVDVKSKA
ncbi:MAG: hypothetical protein WAX04_07615, partial [Oscillospiraceae bacterium]